MFHAVSFTYDCPLNMKNQGYLRTSVDNGVNVNLELVDKFCYLGDMLSVNGDVDAVVENRI